MSNGLYIGWQLVDLFHTAMHCSFLYLSDVAGIITFVSDMYSCFTSLRPALRVGGHLDGAFFHKGIFFQVATWDQSDRRGTQK